MPEISNKFVVLAITQDEARVWATGLEKGTHPEKIHAPSDKLKHHHVKQAQHHGGHDVDPAVKGYFDVIEKSISNAAEVLIIGHGSGKANTMVRFVQYLERNHRNTAKKIIGAIDSDLNALTESQILAEARRWFDQHHRTGL